MAGAVMTVATVLLYQLEMSVAALVAIRLISGVGFSALTTAAHAAAADLLPESRLAEGLGFYGVADTVAAAAGPAIGFFLYGHFGCQPSCSLSWSPDLLEPCLRLDAPLRTARQREEGR